MWEMRSGKQVGKLNGHEERMTSLAFHPKGETLVSGSLDGTIRFWNVRDRKETRRIAVRGWRVIFSPKGDILASCDGLTSAVDFRDSETGNKVRTIPDCGGEVGGLAFSPDGTKIATVGLSRRAFVECENRPRDWPSSGAPRHRLQPPVLPGWQDSGLARWRPAGASVGPADRQGNPEPAYRRQRRILQPTKRRPVPGRVARLRARRQDAGGSCRVGWKPREEPRCASSGRRPPSPRPGRFASGATFPGRSPSPPTAKWWQRLPGGAAVACGCGRPRPAKRCAC